MGRAKKTQRRKAERLIEAEWDRHRSGLPSLGIALVNKAKLAIGWYCIYEPEFMRTGVYRTLFFRCRECGREDIWTATQQKWWYEVAKGTIYSCASRCASCRHKKRLWPKLSRALASLDSTDPDQLLHIADLYKQLRIHHKALLYLRRAKNRTEAGDRRTALESRIAALAARVEKATS